VLEAVALVRDQLDDDVALIGFAGAPFTVASYLVEGGKSRDYRHTKALMYRQPDVLGRAGRAPGRHHPRPRLRAQVEAGAQAIQVFDSWVGALSADDYREHVLPANLPHLRRPGRPRRAPHPLRRGGRAPLAPARRGRRRRHRRRLAQRRWPTPAASAPPSRATSTPVALFAPPEVLDAKVRAVLVDAGDEPGHIFNLGWGRGCPATDPDMLTRVVDVVHRGL